MPETVGQLLNRIRTERKLTIEQASHATHIRIHFLRALEEDQPDIMPSVAQGRGFLRLYAGYLDTPVEPLLAVWPNQLVLEQAQDTTDEPDASLDNPQEPHAQGSSTSQSRNAEPSSPDANQSANVEDHTQEQIEHVASGQTSLPTSSQEIFASLGAAFQQQRESLSLSLTDVENHTHIRSHHLEAIENGQIANLPSPVQGRGMLKNYAQFLNLNSEAVLLEYADGLQARRIEKNKPNVQKQTAAKKPGAKRSLLPPAVKRWLSADMLIGIFAILILVTITIWGISQVSADRSRPAEPTAPPVADILLNDTNAELTQIPQITETRETDAPRENNINDPQVDPVQETGDGEPGIPTLDNQPLQLYLVSSQRAWLQIIADEETVFEGRVIPGNAYPFSAVEKIDLLTGNGAALKAYFNQQDLGILGEVGEVVNISFTASGVIIPTPITPPTPTATQVPPTATPEPTSDAVLPTPTVTPFIP